MLYFPERLGRHSLELFDLPSWAGMCQNTVLSIRENPQPLLSEEIVAGTDGPFCAGGRNFEEAPIIHQCELHLKGFVIDKIGHIYHNTFSTFTDDQTQQRQWFRTAGGLAVLGPEQARAGCLLTILIGGKTPFLLKQDHKEANHFRLVSEWYVTSQSFRDTRYRALISLATRTGWICGEYLANNPTAQPKEIILV